MQGSNNAKRRQRTKPQSVQEHLTAGTVGGLVATVLLYPLDVVKVRYQVANAGKAYSSIGSALNNIVQTEGLRALYQGVGVAALSASMSWGGYFFFYELMKKRMRKDGGTEPLNAVQHLAAGFQAGGIMVFVTNPLWLIKIRMQLQRKAPGNQHLYKNGFDAMRTIVREEGVLALYKGVVPALLLTSNGAVQFMAYEWLKQQWADTGYSQTPLASVAMGAASKVFASTVTYPFQVIKTRLQQRYLDTGAVLQSTQRYGGVVDCVAKTWRQEGLYGFFKGSIPNALRVAPASAVTFVVYEETLRLFR